MTAETLTRLYCRDDVSLYPAGMVRRVLAGVGDFRLYLRDRMQAGRAAGEHTLVSARGTPDSVLVPIEWYRRASDALGELDEDGEIRFSLFVAPERSKRKPSDS